MHIVSYYIILHDHPLHPHLTEERQGRGDEVQDEDPREPDLISYNININILWYNIITII